MTLNFVGMGMEAYGDFEGLDVLGNFRIRTMFHAKDGKPIFLEAQSASVMTYYYMKGGRKRMYKKPHKVSAWGLCVYCHIREGDDPCNEHRLFSGIVEEARYTAEDLLGWINRRFGTTFDSIYIADGFDDFTCDMFSEDWVADKSLHDRRKAAYEKYYQYVKGNSKNYPFEGRWFTNRHREFPCLSVVGKTPKTITIANCASEAELKYCGLEREVILNV